MKYSIAISLGALINRIVLWELWGSFYSIYTKEPHPKNGIGNSLGPYIGLFREPNTMVHVLQFVHTAVRQPDLAQRGL